MCWRSETEMALVGKLSRLAKIMAVSNTVGSDPADHCGRKAGVPDWPVPGMYCNSTTSTLSARFLQVTNAPLRLTE